MINRFKGCLLGLACGDAVGTTLEFSTRGNFIPITDMIGGGPFRLQPGQWTDDTSMALCLAMSLLERKCFDPIDQMNRYCKWYQYGYNSSTGTCFDIGLTISKSLQDFMATKNPFSGPVSPRTAGNGGIMRLAPIPMYFFNDEDSAVFFSGESNRTTHGADETIQCARLFGKMLRMALNGQTKEDILFKNGYKSLLFNVQDLAEGRYVNKPIYDIKGTGYVMQSLEAALWCFANTTNFRDAILIAANLGDDADTTAAIVGQIAGAHYGVDDIPTNWLNLLTKSREIEQLAVDLFEQRFVYDQ